MEKVLCIEAIHCIQGTGSRVRLDHLASKAWDGPFVSACNKDDHMPPPGRLSIRGRFFALSFLEFETHKIRIDKQRRLPIP